MARRKRKAVSCWHVVGFYTGDLWRVGKRGERPVGIVYGTHNKRTAVREAQALDAKEGPGGHRFVRAFQCNRAGRLFELKV